MSEKKNLGHNSKRDFLKNPVEHIDIIVKAILAITPTAKYALRNHDVPHSEWLENTTPIPVADIDNN